MTIARVFLTLFLACLFACGSPRKAEPLRALTPEESAVIVIFNNPADNEILRKHAQFVSSTYYFSEESAKIRAFQSGGNVIEVFTTSNHSETTHRYQQNQYKTSTKNWKRSMAIIHRLPDEFLKLLSKGPAVDAERNNPKAEETDHQTQ